MAPNVRARLSPAEGRKFGLQIGGMFLLLTAIAWWRGRMGAVPWLGGIGGALLAAGLLAPVALGPVHRAWMALAGAISRVTTPVVMAAIYFLVLTPIGILMRALGRNPLVHPEAGGGYWVRRAPDEAGRGSMERQF